MNFAYNLRRILPPFNKHTLLMNTRSISSKFNLENNKCKKVFSVDFGDVKGTVDYDLDGDVYILNDSYIPDEVRGKGYGHLLAKNVFDYIATKNNKMIINCTFLNKVYEENKNTYENFVIEDQ